MSRWKQLSVPMLCWDEDLTEREEAYYNEDILKQLERSPDSYRKLLSQLPRNPYSMLYEQATDRRR